MLGDKRHSQFGEEAILSVSEYSNYINEIVSTEAIVVEGEVSNFREIPGRNFLYFDIKDENSVAKCFQGFWRSKKVELQNGSLVRINGFPTMQKNGSFVIDVREISLVGEGDLMQRYLKLKGKLEKEGLFDEKHKKQLPAFPLTIGLVAGKNSSAYHDVIAEITERWQGTNVLFYPAKVQGIYAKKQVATAIKFFNREKPVDVLIVARGGGSLEDLVAFDSEEVVREIFASKIPVVSAIGHEDHWTLADFVSDVRAKTPTKAAQISVPSLAEVEERLDYFSDRAKFVLSRQLEESKSKLKYLSDRTKLFQTKLIQEVKKQLSDKLEKSEMAVLSLIGKHHDKLDGWQKILELLDQSNVLKRGFAVVEKDGKKIESVKFLKAGDTIKTTLQDGQIDSTIM